jgi:hypothetical protein
VIGVLNLTTILNELVKHSEFVADPVARYGQLQIRATIQEAGCQSPETTISQAGVVFLFGQLLELDTVLVQRLSGGFVEVEILNRVAQ